MGTVLLRLDGGRARRVAGLTPRSLVWGLSTSRLCRGLPRVQARTLGLPDDHVEHPAGSADAPALVPERLVHDDGGRHPTVRGVLRRVVLYTLKYVDGPVLLRLRVYWT